MRMQDSRSHLCRLVIVSAVVSVGFSFDKYEFPDPIERYRECGLPKPGRFCDPKGLLANGERMQANDALLKLPINVVAILDISHIFNASDPLDFTLIDINDFHKNVSQACQHHPTNCVAGSPLFIVEFLKMPADAVGGDRFDISFTQGSRPFGTTDERVESVFEKALDASMVDFVKLNLSQGLATFAQNFNEAYTKSRSNGWTAATFPNPCLSPLQCGIGNRVDAYICDPDSILKAEQRQHVNREFRNVGQGNRLYAALGEPILGDLDTFAKAVFSNWSIECVKHERPKPFALVVVHLSPFQTPGHSLLNASSVSDGVYLSTVVRYVMENEAGMASISDRLIEIARRVNGSWDGQRWHAVTLATTIGPNISTRAGRDSGCARNFGFTSLIHLCMLSVCLSRVQ